MKIYRNVKTTFIVLLLEKQSVQQLYLSKNKITFKLNKILFSTIDIFQLIIIQIIFLFYLYKKRKTYCHHLLKRKLKN